jgi:tRNA C32,U32 (ribose-2'-O)-methylase TrmJ
VNIPTTAEFGSLNLAMAAQVICYELRMAAPNRPPPVVPGREAPLATAPSSKGCTKHLEQLLTASGFLHPDHQRQVKLKLRRFSSARRSIRTRSASCAAC